MPDLSLGLIFVMNGIHPAPAFSALAVPRADKTLRTERAELTLTLCVDLTGVLSGQRLQTWTGAGVSGEPGLGWGN